MAESPADRATREYAQALAQLRAARQRFVDAHVPMQVEDGRPPVWTSDQHGAVVSYAKAWTAFVRARQSATETGATTTPQRAPVLPARD
jgi:hypothetical protein